MRTQIEILVIVIMLCAGAVVAQWDGWGGSPVRRPAAASGAVVDGHWTLPYDTVLLFDGQSGTNINEAYGSIGSAMDNSDVGGVANHGVVTNSPNVITGAGFGTEVAGTNNLGDLIRVWKTDGADDWFRVADNDRYSFGVGPDFTNDNPFTAACWIKQTNSFASAGYFFKGNQAIPNYEWEASMAGGTTWKPRLLLYALGGAGGTFRTWVVNDDQMSTMSNNWTFLLWTYTGETNASGSTGTNAVKIYINGIVQQCALTKSGSGTFLAMTNSTVGLGVGTRKGDAFSFGWGGNLGFPLIIPSALTSAQQWTVYQNLGGQYGPTNSILKKKVAGAYP